MNEEFTIDEGQESNFNPIWNSLLRPRQAIRYVVDNNIRLYFGVLIYLYGLTSSMHNYARRDYSLSPLRLLALMVFAPIAGYISLYIYGWIISLFGKVFSGVATNEELRTTILWSTVPYFMILPITLITFVGGSSNLKHIVYGSLLLKVLYWLLEIIEIVIGIWCFINLVRMVSEVQGFSKGKAFWSIVLPAVIVVTIVLIFALFFYI